MTGIGVLDKLKQYKEIYPNREIIFKVDTEVVADDYHSWWYSESGQVGLDSVLSGSAEHEYGIKLDDERMYSMSDDEDELLDMFFDEYGHHYENEIPRYVKNLPWNEVIVIRVTT